ncbi:MAG: hypothetical protein WDO24_26320 [Pseudomonadota bacterium]
MLTLNATNNYNGNAAISTNGGNVAINIANGQLFGERRRRHHDGQRQRDDHGP